MRDTYNQGYLDGLRIAAEMVKDFDIDGEIDCTSNPKKALEVLVMHIDEEASKFRDHCDLVRNNCIDPDPDAE